MRPNSFWIALRIIGDTFWWSKVSTGHHEVSIQGRCDAKGKYLVRFIP
uniref:Uncharacterized protein n=1 Tax=Arundo donax TaxID=35708 RepID=A0A0A9EPM8_ARUDO